MTVERKSALVEALADQASNLALRFPGYQEQVLERLTRIVMNQDSYAAETARRKAISDEVSALADLVILDKGAEGAGA